ncbi:MAG: hypothetical protein IJL30_05835 [Clostridia bacterium]|nr:hypothetical protein [Clostridia bacterium]
MKEKKTLEEKYAKPGEELRTGTIVVMGIGFFVFLIMLYFSTQMQSNGWIFIVIGIVLWLFCILIVSKNLKGWIYGKRRESLLKSGKLKESAKKTYNREHRFDEE